MEDGFEEAAALGLGPRELRFELITDRHQFVDLGDDAILLGEWGDRNCERTNVVEVQSRLAGTVRAL